VTAHKLIVAALALVCLVIVIVGEHWTRSEVARAWRDEKEARRG
jgi:hypothetical protein